VETGDYASQQYTSVDDVIMVILYLIVFAQLPDLPIVAVSGDLSRAYRRLAVPYTEWWMQCTHAVFRLNADTPTFAWLVDKALQFGGRLGPIYFSRVTAALAWAVTLMVVAGMHVIDYARKWRDEVEHGKLGGVMPISGEHLSASRRDALRVHAVP
jgi:hypothetical protein